LNERLLQRLPRERSLDLDERRDERVELEGREKGRPSRARDLE
jgi:hypothetical protein